MANLTNQIPAYLNSEFIQTALENYLCCSEVKIMKFAVTALACGAGENYCSDIYEVSVKYQLFNDSQEHTEQLVIKSLPKTKQMTLKDLKIYNRELYFYKNVLPKMELLMKLHQKNYTIAPSFIYNNTQPIETLVFQNLMPLGFKLQNRQMGLDKPHAIMVLQKLAQYHAASLCLNANDENLLANILQRYAFGLLNMNSCKSDSFKFLFRAQLQKLIEILKQSKDFNISLIKKLETYSANFTERVLEAVYPLEGKINVLNHGDLWVNNIMFLYGNEDEQLPTDVRFLDFQLSFYGSLGFDVNYFLNTSVQLDVLQHNRYQLLDIYTNTLLQTLNKLPYTIDLLPTKVQIEQEIHEKEAYGFFVAFAFFPLMSMLATDSRDNSLDKLKDTKFAEQKIQLMFTSNKRTIDTLKFNIKRLEQLGIL